MKSPRDRLDILAAYRDLGSYRAAAELCGTTDKTVKRVVLRQRAGPPPPRPPRTHNTAVAGDVVREKLAATDGRISAKRLLPLARAAGYTGSGRNFRRLVHERKEEWRRRRRSYRPWLPTPGEHLAIDWGQIGPLHIFCAVLVWSRVRFVRFALDERRETTLRLLAECFEELGGVPVVVLADRMGCLKAGVVANVVVPHPEYVRFAMHFGCRPDFCEAHDPESKGVVENLVGYAKADLVIPLAPGASLAEANRAAIGWCAEVNGAVHSETQAIPAARLLVERSALRALPSLRPPLRHGEARKVDRLATIRFGSARYSVPSALVSTTVEVAAIDGEIVITQQGTEIARHLAVAPGEASILDAHYGGPRSRPARAVRPRNAAERAFVALGDPAEQFLRAAAAAGTARLGSELAEIASLEPAFGREPLIAAIERASTFHRFRSADVRAILDAGEGVMQTAVPGAPLQLALPTVPVRPLSAYAIR
ncbi:MAG: IS21 family transposase [Solirubrobacteraceae bacterium]